MAKSNFYTYVESIGNQIFVREVDQLGRRTSRRLKGRDFRPVLYEPDPNGEFVDIFGRRLSKVSFETIRECREYVREYEEQKQIYGMTNLAFQYISERYSGEIHYDPQQIRVFVIDIETLIGNEGFSSPERAATPITAISVYDSFADQIVCFYHMTDAQNQKVADQAYEGTLAFYRSEKDMLEAFVNFWQTNCPDVISGWNCSSFDIPYIYKRLLKLFDEEFVKKLSPFDFVTERMVPTSYDKNKKELSVNIYGVVVLDYLDLYKKFTYNSRESYKLDAIAQYELNEKKIDYSDVGNLNDLYFNAPDRFVRYNIHDVMLVKRLDAKLKFFDIAYGIAYQSKSNYQDALGVVKVWDAYIYNRLKEKNIVVPPAVRYTKNEKYQGAFVKPPIRGLHEWVVTFDAGSLYPNLIRQYNMSPETLQNKDLFVPPSTEDLIAGTPDLNFLQQENLCIAGNGSLFDAKTPGVIPPIVKEVLDERKIAKKIMLAKKQELENTTDETLRQTLKFDIARYEAKQMAMKTLANSLYGAMGNASFRYFRIEIAEAITLSGRLVIQWLERKVNEFFQNYFNDTKDRVIAIDTDSVMLDMSDLVKKLDLPKHLTDEKITTILDALCEKDFGKRIDGWVKELATYTNAFDQTVFFKREKIANKGLFLTKKRYILSVLNNEGVTYSRPKITMTGIELVKSSMPKFCRDLGEKLVPFILNKEKDTCLRMISEFWEQFKKQPVELISSPSSVNGMTIYKGDMSLYKKGTPHHVKAALTYNLLIDRLQLGQKYDKIRDGNKIKYISVRSNNKYQADSIGFLDTFPSEFNDIFTIDYEEQFEKVFINVIKTMTDVLNWNISMQQTSLEDFFV